VKIGRKTAEPEVRAAAVNEMLLRLRWDDRDELARAKLTRIVACIWDGLEGRPVPFEPPSSALWLDDGKDADIPEAFTKIDSKGLRCSADEALEALDDELQRQLEELPTDLWAKMEAFAIAKPLRGRLRLPAGLSPLQRKAVHMWATARGLGSKSFGIGRRRRLRLAVPEAFGEGGALPAVIGNDEEHRDCASKEDDDEEWLVVKQAECSKDEGAE